MEKRILCFGDSNTWGYDAYSGGRFARDVRWTGVLQNTLAKDYHIIEEGLCGRTTVFDDPLNEGLNGFRYLLPCLQSHLPIDMLIIMLGTNDCKERFAATAKNIRSEEHTSELQSPDNLVCRLLLEKKNTSMARP